MDGGFFCTFLYPQNAVITIVGAVSYNSLVQNFLHPVKVCGFSTHRLLSLGLQLC